MHTCIHTTYCTYSHDASYINTVHTYIHRSTTYPPLSSILLVTISLHSKADCKKQRRVSDVARPHDPTYIWRIDRGMLQSVTAVSQFKEIAHSALPDAIRTYIHTYIH